jgi:multisubunit Na+/H+ antiporter MnhB subunit
MEDFVRLNLNGLIGLLAFLLVIMVIFVILKKTVDKEYQKFINWFLWASLGIAGLSVVFMLISQLSTNQLPKSVIDRSYQKQSLKNYQNSVEKGAKQ